MKKTIMILLVLALVAIVGCEEQTISIPLPEDPAPTVTNFDECIAAGNPAMESYPRQCRHGDRTFTEEIEEPIMPPEEKKGKILGDVKEEPEEPEEEAGPVCGDGICDENCQDCPEDCKCGIDEACYDGACKKITCGRDYECDDDEACTTDICQYPAHPNAYCDHEDVVKCRNNDDCCPEECNANDDNDCDPVCGNDECEEDEGDDCPKDCEND
ncbi:hypothetical protein ACFL96_10660 [Thermoproteota archaeon]